MAAAAGHHKGMHEIVGLEDARPKIGPMDPVEYGTDAVGQAAQPRQAKRPVRELASQLEIEEDRCPAHAEIERRRECPRYRYRQQAERDASERECPGRDQG